MEPYRILISVSRLVLCKKVKKTILSSSVDIVGETGDELECLYLVNKLKPDLVILDAELGGDSGIKALTEIKRNDCKIKVVLIMSIVKPNMPSFFFGADGFILKNSLEELPQAIEEIRNGGIYMSRSIREKVLGWRKNQCRAQEQKR